MIEKIGRWLPLLLISSLGLFFELAVIRWMSSEVRLLSYFKNLPLLAAFLGLAIGFALVRKGRDYRSAFAPLLLIVTVVVIAIGRFASPLPLAYPGGDEFVWYRAPLADWIALIIFLGTVLVFFVLTMLLFIPLGQATGLEMAQHAPVSAYFVNLIGSLLGVWVFAVLSLWQASPPIWFGLGLIALSLYLWQQRALPRLSIVLYGVILIGLALSGRGEIWSPYQRLEVTELALPQSTTAERVTIGYRLNIQQVFYQQALNLSETFRARWRSEYPELDDMALTYDLPFRLGVKADQVAIVGAGMGNDVAGALRNGAGHVDAVEIDPAIEGLGRQLHPEQPYADGRVSAIVDDARSFFKKTDRQYDVIAFGLLDSHTLLSGLSNVRLDSFVYTLESFQQARDHLKPGGVLAVTFAADASAPWIEERLGRILNEVFGRAPVYVHRGALGATFLVGALTPQVISGQQLMHWQSDPARDVPLSSDDWPYLYMRDRIVPGAYWQVLLLIGVVSFLIIRRSFPEVLRPNWHFFLLGAAFLLVEFKSVTEFALLFGTTWLVNALAISGVLLMALLANILVLKWKTIILSIVYGLLFLTLLVTFVFPLDALVGLPPLARAIVSMGLLSLPLFFAGIIFSESLRRAGETAGPLSSNLFGSVAGGILEYGSLLWGIKSLYVIAGLTYLGARLALRGRKQ